MGNRALALTSVAVTAALAIVDVASIPTAGIDHRTIPAKAQVSSGGTKATTMVVRFPAVGALAVSVGTAYTAGLCDLPLSSCSVDSTSFCDIAAAPTHARNTKRTTIVYLFVAIVVDAVKTNLFGSR